MATFGAGELGNRTVSADETDDRDVLQYMNLTVEAGNTLTLSHGVLLQVADTLQIEGTLAIPTNPDRPGGVTSFDSIPAGGAAGGSANIMAQTTTGGGTIQAMGGDGENAQVGAGVSEGGNVGTGYTNPYPPTSGTDPPAGGNTGDGGAGGSFGGPGGDGGADGSGQTQPGPRGMQADDNLAEFLESWAIPSIDLAKGQYRRALAGSAASGSGESGGQGDGGSGGGSGGYIAFITASLGTNITFSCDGGVGGDGSDAVGGSNGNGGGGGGGGGGGMLLLWTDVNPQPSQISTAGGVGGAAGLGDGGGADGDPGTDGGLGIAIRYDVSDVPGAV